MLQQRLEEVHSRIDAAALRAGRKPEDITMIAVTKKFPPAIMREAYDCGLRQFGENYVQEFEGKHPELRSLSDACFHLIGHLQSNKTRKAAELFHVIQTVDSAKLVRRLAETGKNLELLIEVKLSHEEAKAGAEPETIGEIVEAATAFSNVRLAGLMTMPPWSDEAEPSRPYFIRLRKLAEEHKLPKLSMGMSHDFEVAIEEGATYIRVGTALFGPRRKA